MCPRNWLGSFVMEIEKKQLKSVSCSLKNFTFENNKDYMIVTEWANGEGWDISIGDKLISLHSGELAAINYLTAMIDYDYE